MFSELAGLTKVTDSPAVEVAVVLPPLRDRREDLHLLVRYFLQRAGHADAKATFPYYLALAHYSWPYNVRELESAVKLSLALSDGGALDLQHLPAPIQEALDGHGETRPSIAPPPQEVAPPAKKSRSKAPPEEELRALLVQHAGNIAAVGRSLGKERMQIHRWLKRYGIDPTDYR